MSETLIYDLPWARFLAGNNELKLRAKTVKEAGPAAADAVMFRFQVPHVNLSGSGWLGAIAADVIDSNGVERVQIKLGFKLDPGPVLEVYMTTPGSAGNDADEKLVFRLPGGVSSPSRVTRFYSDNGKFCYNVQGDPASGPAGRIVVYDTNNNHPDEGTWTAVGLITPEPL